MAQSAGTGGGGDLRRGTITRVAVAGARRRPAPWSTPSPPPWASRKRRHGEETVPMSAHIIGRPNDDLLDIMLGHGADPEQAFIGGSEQGREEGEAFDDHLRGDEPTVPEL